MNRDQLLERYNDRPLVFTVVLGLSIMLLITVALMLLTCGQTAYYAMFPNKDGIFMDYFDSIYYSLNNPYTEHYVIYPPLITVIYEVIGRLALLDGIYDPYVMRGTYTGLFSYTILLMISMFLLYRLLSRNLTQDNRKANELLIFLLIISYPVVFAVMRGNCIIYSMILLELFLLGYRSENKVFRYLSYLCLACSASMKIYVALFGLLVVRERNVRDILVCAGMGLIVLLLPFVFTDGNLMLFLENSINYAMSKTATFPIVNIGDVVLALKLLDVSDSAVTTITVLLCIVTYAITAFIILTRRNIKRWEMVMLLSSNIIIGLGVSSPYLMVFLLLAVPFFLSEEKEPTKRNLFICILLILVFMLFPGFDDTYVARNFFISVKGVATFILYGLIVCVLLRRKDEGSAS